MKCLQRILNLTVLCLLQPGPACLPFKAHSSEQHSTEMQTWLQLKRFGPSSSTSPKAGFAVLIAVGLSQGCQAHFHQETLIQS